MANRTCTHGSAAPVEILENLHISQAGIRNRVLIWRHKCCECAFVRGEALGRIQAVVPGGNAECKRTGLRAPLDLLEALPISQAGGDISRHKCVICALHAGFEQGRQAAAH